MAIPSVLNSAGPGAASLAAAPPPKGLKQAAQQFEALLIGQMLKSARSDEGGWLGTGDDTGDATAAELAEEQFAQALAANGGLGLSSRIVADLTPAGQNAAASQTPTLRGVVHRAIQH